MATSKLFLLFGAALGGTAVAMGAFGAHALRKVLSAEMLSVYQTGVLYQMVHGLALLAVGLIVRHYEVSAIVWAGWLLFAGALFFSGSLYVLSMTSIRYVGLLTPLGGLFFIGGWLLLFIGIFRKT